jgi:hypothetical protein
MIQMGRLRAPRPCLSDVRLACRRGILLAATNSDLYTDSMVP